MDKAAVQQAARAAVQQSMEQVDAARDNLQTILDNLTAGVVVLDEDGRVRSVNPGAARILHTPLAVHMGQPLAEVPGLTLSSYLSMGSTDSPMRQRCAAAMRTLGLREN